MEPLWLGRKSPIRSGPGDMNAKLIRHYRVQPSLSHTPAPRPATAQCTAPATPGPRASSRLCHLPPSRVLRANRPTQVPRFRPVRAAGETPRVGARPHGAACRAGDATLRACRRSRALPGPGRGPAARLYVTAPATQVRSREEPRGAERPRADPTGATPASPRWEEW